MNTLMPKQQSIGVMANALRKGKPEISAPVHNSPSLTLYHADCMDIMREMPDKAFDLAIIDPPYGIGERLVKGGGNQGCWGGMTKSGADQWDIAPPPEYFEELFRVSKNQIVWGGNFFDLPPCKMPICWDKVRPNQKCASEWEYAWTSFEGRARKFEFCANGGFIEPSPRIHPTQKPVPLYAWLLAEFAEPGWRILDTHLGSGSSAIACHFAGHHLTAMEKDGDYVAAALERFKRETAQGDVFADRPELLHQQEVFTL